jgi:hypothetical protein
VSVARAEAMARATQPRFDATAVWGGVECTAQRSSVPTRVTQRRWLGSVSVARTACARQASLVRTAAASRLTTRGPLCG